MGGVTLGKQSHWFKLFANSAKRLEKVITGASERIAREGQADSAVIGINVNTSRCDLWRATFRDKDDLVVFHFLELGRLTGSHSRRRGLRHQPTVRGLQFTKCWTVAQQARRFGTDAELCGCALLGGYQKNLNYLRESIKVRTPKSNSNIPVTSSPKPRA